MKELKGWPPIWLEDLYCNWISKITRITSIFAFVGMLILMIGIAWALLTGDAKGKSKGEQGISLFTLGVTPPYGMLVCWPDHGKEFEHTNYGFMEDPMICGIATDPLTHKIKVVKTRILDLINKNWQVLEIEKNANRNREIYMIKPKR